MAEDINETISVISIFDSKTGESIPKKINWNNRTYNIDKIGFHHTQKKGDIIHHLYSVNSKDLFMLLDLNTETLQWKLKNIETIL